MPELTPHQAKAIELLRAQLEATLALHNHMNPEYAMTFEEAMQKLSTKK